MSWLTQWFKFFIFYLLVNFFDFSLGERVIKFKLEGKILLKPVLENKEMKGIEKRKAIIELITANDLNVKELEAESVDLDSKKQVILFEAIEEITKENPTRFDSSIVDFMTAYLSNESNPIKRETSRIIGNVAVAYPDNLERSIALLIQNTTKPGTVVRWGSAYALSRILLLPNYVNASLYDTVKMLSDQEEENGVKKQYLNALKKADKKRS